MGHNSRAPDRSTALGGGDDRFARLGHAPKKPGSPPWRDRLAQRARDYLAYQYDLNHLVNQGLTAEAARANLAIKEIPEMPGEMALRVRCKAMGLPVRAGGLEDQPYALTDAFLICDVVEAEFRRRVKGS